MSVINRVGEWVAGLPWWAIVAFVLVMGIFWLKLRTMPDDRLLVNLGFNAPKPEPKQSSRKNSIKENESRKKEKQKATLLSVRWTREFVESLIIAVVLVFGLVRPFIAQSFYIPSESMQPGLQVGDRLLVNKFVYFFREPKRGEIIVFKAPPGASIDMAEKDLVKRIIGVPGDVIEIRGGLLYVNGKQQREKYVKGTQVIHGFDSANGNPIQFEEEMQNPYQLADGFKPTGDYDGLKRLSETRFKVEKGYYFMMGDNRNNSNDSRKWGGLHRDRVVGKAWVRFWPITRIGLIR